MLPSVQHLYQELLSVLHTVLHIRMCPPKVLQVQNRLGLDASSFRAKFAGNVTAGQYMCCREDFTHWFSNFHSYYMKRDESCLVANSPSESKFSESIRCQKMVEIHGYNEHISVTGEDDNPCHATLYDSMNSVRNYSDVGLFMVGVKVWVLEHFSILYRLCGC